MNPSEPSVRIRVGTLRVTAGSAVEARLLAAALPGAIERALTSDPAPQRATPAPGSGLATRRADEVAAALVEALRGRLARGGPA
nr:hypothetical protein [Streptomyces antibioticus]